MTTVEVGRDLFGPLLEGVIGRSGIGLSVLDDDLCYVFANDVVARLYDAPPAAVVGRPIHEVLPQIAPVVTPILRRALDEGIATRRVEIEGKVPGGHGDVGHWMATYLPLEAGGRRYVAAVIVEVTEQRREQRRVEALATLSSSLNSALRTEEVAQLVVEQGPHVVDVDFVNVGLLDRDSRTVQMVLPPRIEVIAEWSPVSLDGPRTPFHHVIETGTPIFVDDANRGGLFPHLVEEAARAGLRSVAVLPLFDSDGSVLGGLGLAWSEQVQHTEQSRARMTVLADLCSKAMQRVRTTETRDDLVEELQREILAPWQAPRQLNVGVAYRPANNELGFGGDWYDVITLGDRAVFVVGDVAGHGTPAAARMTATKATIRAFVTAFEPEEVIPRVTEALAHLQSGYVATAALAWVDPVEHTLQWCLAGHPPPVLRTPDGVTRLLEGVHHPPIGMRRGTVPLPKVPFPPGSKLILYTDGLIERRHVHLDERLEALRATVEALPRGLPAGTICDRLIGGLADENDDVAVIVIRDPGTDGVPSR